ncbi:hypothetical protein QQF64_019589 [Cirrhinus molitorella]|uniref:Uncharacterized protein n=1 Tax=Cirrhinus molitorella TaxID=172907 RepID=A0ABR3LJY7_9TELE
MGIGGALGYRRLVKAVSAAQNPTKLAGWIETVVGRAVSTQTVVMDRKMENIIEKLAALQRILDKPETNGLSQGRAGDNKTSPGEQDNETL